MKEKFSQILTSLKKNLTVTACVALVFLVIIVLVAVFSTADEAATEDTKSWGDGITDGIPAFDGENGEFAFGDSGEYAAAYYKNVSSEQTEEYIKMLESELSVEFTDGEFPKSAIYGEKIIALHYNITEMTFSVTVAKKGDSEASKEITQSGEEQQ